MVEFTGEGDTSLLKSIRIDEGDAVVETYDKQRALLELLKRYPNSDDIVKEQLLKLKFDKRQSEAKARILEHQADALEGAGEDNPIIAAMSKVLLTRQEQQDKEDEQHED